MPDKPPAPDPAEIRQMEARLKEVRDQRIATQRRAAVRPALEQALRRTSRDRSALTSQQVDAARDRVQGLHDQLVTSWDAIDRVRLMAGRIRRRASHQISLEQLMPALDVEAAGRVTVQRKAQEAGVNLFVPPPYMVGLVSREEAAAAAAQFEQGNR